MYVVPLYFLKISWDVLLLYVIFSRAQVSRCLKNFLQKHLSFIKFFFYFNRFCVYSVTIFLRVYIYIIINQTGLDLTNYR